MEFSEAVNWVKSNQGLIKKTIGKYSMFSPYEENDYMQDAFESAMVATLRSKSKGISFESAAGRWGVPDTGADGLLYENCAVGAFWV